MSSWYRHHLRSLFHWSAGSVLLLLTVKCGSTPTEEEKAFYQQVAQVEVGMSTQDVHRLLGDASKIADAQTPCNEPAGKKAWIYDTFTAGGIKKDLPHVAFIFCMGVDGRVVQKHEVVR